MEGGFEVDLQLVFQLVLCDFAGHDVLGERAVADVGGAIFDEPSVGAGIADDPSQGVERYILLACEGFEADALVEWDRGEDIEICEPAETGEIEDRQVGVVENGLLWRYEQCLQRVNSSE